MRKKPFVGQFGAKNDYEDYPKNECCTPDGKKMKTKIWRLFFPPKISDLITRDSHLTISGFVLNENVLKNVSIFAIFLEYENPNNLFF